VADKQIELGPLLFEGRTKQVYAAPNKELIVIHYKEDKGIYNNKLSGSFFRLLESSGIPSHFVTRINDREQLCRKIEIISLQAVVRSNPQQPQPLVELFCKSEKDKPISREEAASAAKAKTEEIDYIIKTALQIYTILGTFLQEKKLLLAECTLEFGRTEEGQIELADEISSDTCCILDLQSKQAVSHAELWDRIGAFQLNT